MRLLLHTLCAIYLVILFTTYTGTDNNLYNKVGISQKAKIKGFLMMLYGITLNFYYKNKAIYITFNSICNTIYNHFKGLKYKHKILIK